MFVARRLLSLATKTGHYSERCGSFLRAKPGAIPQAELRYLQCTCCWMSRVPVTGFETLDAALADASEPCKDPASRRPLDAFYTPEQQEAILQLLNTGSPDELTGVKLLRGRKSANIVEYRTKHGPFTTLESVVNVPQFQHKSAVVVFNSILDNSNPEPAKKEKRVKIKFLTPEVDRSWLMSARTIVSLVCGTNKVAWAHVDCGRNLLAWQQVECPHFLKGKYMASTYLDDISAVVSLLPSADFYVIEKQSISHKNTNLFPIMAHLRVVEAMLFALLEPKNLEPDCNVPPRVLNLMRAAVGRHFGLMLGDTRTSGAHMVQQLMTESVTQTIPRIIFPQEMLFKYRNYFPVASRRSQAEELSDSLLQAIAFYELLSESSS